MLYILLPIQYFPGNSINFRLILHLICGKLHFPNLSAIIQIFLCPNLHLLILSAGFFQCNFYSLFLCNLFLRNHIFCKNILGTAEHLPGISIHLILQISQCIMLQLHLIMGAIFIQLRVYLPGKFHFLRSSGILCCSLTGCGLADRHSLCTRFLHIPQLFHTQSGQLPELQRCILCLYLLNHLRFSHGNVIFFCLFLQSFIVLNLLCQNLRICFLILESSIYRSAQLLLNLSRTLCI